MILQLQLKMNSKAKQPPSKLNSSENGSSSKDLSSCSDDTPIEHIPYKILPTREGGLSNSIHQDFLFKLIVIGDSGVGKSCLMHRVTTNEFTDDHEVTVGVEFGSLMIKIEECTFKMQIWDTAGQESFQSITKIFYRGAHAVLLTYSIANKLTFDNLDHWLEEIKSQSEPDAFIILVGNQSDKEEQRQVSVEKALQYRSLHNLDLYIETSAKTSHNVEEAFTLVARMLYKKFRTKIAQKKNLDLDTKLGNANKKLKKASKEAEAEKQKKKGCCK